MGATRVEASEQGTRNLTQALSIAAVALGRTRDAEAVRIAPACREGDPDRGRLRREAEAAQGCLITGGRLIEGRENGESLLPRLPFNHELSYLDFPFSKEGAKIRVKSLNGWVVVKRLEEQEVKTGGSSIPDTA